MITNYCFANDFPSSISILYIRHLYVMTYKGTAIITNKLHLNGITKGNATHKYMNTNNIQMVSANRNIKITQHNSRGLQNDIPIYT